ncbi:hypothetical protein [Rhizobium sp. BK176]|nr:hypothetical protein [Rhizobium sp. BK176]MCS4088931.1 hypothetical protein [Rhizobium sp. BK176]
MDHSLDFEGGVDNPADLLFDAGEEVALCLVKECANVRGVA